jgi:putative addiction module antidote
MSQKVLKVGTSAAVTIPKDLLRALRLKIGDRVTVERDNKRGGAIILPVRRSKLDAELVDWTEKFIAQYRPAFKALARK